MVQRKLMEMNEFMRRPDRFLRSNVIRDKSNSFHLASEWFKLKPRDMADLVGEYEL